MVGVCDVAETSEPASTVLACSGPRPIDGMVLMSCRLVGGILRFRRDA